MKFNELDLTGTLQKSIENLSYNECTPVQEQCMPHILKGKDVAGLAQTGTGKTAAFVIPLIDRILRSKQAVVTAGTEATEATGGAGETGEAKETVNPASATNSASSERLFKDWRKNNFVLILVPTRELAEQVQENVAKLGADSGIKGFAIYGGTSYDKQKEALASGLDFVVATPGRLIDLYKEHLVDLKQVRAIVFDEADRMFDMGFKDDMKYILQRIPRDRQFLVFSATLNFDVLNTAYQFGSEPVEINISRDQATAENVQDEIYHVGSDEKPQHLISLLRMMQPKQTIIFSNFKHNVDRIAKFLIANDLPAMGISSLLSQAQRNRVIEQFKEENEHNILVATDVAARGLDIKGVDLVINYELPGDSESYVHRIGRTGRAGTTGRALSLVCEKDVEALERIEGYLKKKLTVSFLESQHLVTEYAPFPSDYGQSSYSNRSGGAQGSGGFREKRDRGERNQRGSHHGRGSGPRSEENADSREGRRGNSLRNGRSSNEGSHSYQGRRREGASEGQGDRKGVTSGSTQHSQRGGSSRSDYREGSKGGGRPQHFSERSGGHSKTTKRAGGHHGGDGKSQHRHGQRDHRGSHSKTGGTSTASRSSQSIVQRISGFFKKLFS